MNKYNVNRIVWIDNLKAFAIFFLFWAHCCGCLTDLNLFIVAWHMPLFVFASGYTSTGLRNNIHDWHDVNLYIRKLALRIGLPNLLWTTLAMAVGYSFSHRWDRLGIVLIVTLFILCLALFLFYSNEKRWGG